MNNNQYFEIELLSNTNKKDKRKKGKQQARILHIDKQQVIENEYNTIDFNTFFKMFDIEKYELYKQGALKLGGTERNATIKTAKQFYQSVVSVPSEIDKRKKNIELGELYNADGSPIPREDNRNRTQELTHIMQALLIIALQEKKIDAEARSIMSWLNYFRFINYQQVTDYYEFFNDKEKFAQELKENKRYFNTIEKVPFENKDQNIPQVLEVTETEVITTLDSYFTVVDTLHYRLKKALEMLHAVGLIEFASYKYGLKKVGYDSESKQVVYDSHELNSKQRVRVAEIEAELKEQLGLDNIRGKRLYRDKRFNVAFNEYISTIGIETDESTMKFDKICTRHTIAKHFTEKEVQAFSTSNKELYEYYKAGLDVLINDYREKRLEHATKRYSNKADKKIKELENQKKSLDRAYKRKIGKADESALNQIESNIKNAEAYRDLNIAIAEKFITERHRDNLHT